MITFAKRLPKLFLVILFVLAKSSLAGEFFAIKRETKGHSAPPYVLIWYANETYYQNYSLDNYVKIKDLLQQSQHPKAKTVLKQISQDETLFKAAVAQELATLKEHIPTSVFQGAILATNEMASKNEVLLLNSQKKWTRNNIEFDQEDPNQSVIASMPLNRLDTLKKIMALAVKQYGASPSYSIFFKSHGTDSLALTPRITLDGKSISQSQLDDILDEKITPQRLGLTQGQLLDEIANFKLSVDLVVLEACKSGLGIFRDSKISTQSIPSISEYLVLAESDDTQYQNWNYRKWLEPTNQNPGTLFIETQRITIIKDRDLGKRRYSPWFLLPVCITAIWASCELIAYIRRRSKKKIIESQRLSSL